MATPAAAGAATPTAANAKTDTPEPSYAEATSSLERLKTQAALSDLDGEQMECQDTDEGDDIIPHDTDMPTTRIEQDEDKGDWQTVLTIRQKKSLARAGRETVGQIGSLPRARATHTKVSAMVNASIAELKERRGSSMQAIKKPMVVAPRPRGVKKTNRENKAAEKSASTRYTSKKSPTKSLKKGAAKKAQPAKKSMLLKKASLPKKPKKPAAKKAVTPKKTPKN
ncbi:hypothetical protein HPB49_010980 [Dermacentor silvarum]|uniref:Uncharacterized protein n=1 Tax=Dermacentor silvarum TaxID=543639 RepID=A0ACB8CWU2_DERSI|nr:hypothetical protein HPB49_010980 [Dermacentor silvarum]